MKKGISLIVLVITIIVMIIIASAIIISISNSGIISKAREAAVLTDIAAIKQEAEIVKLELVDNRKNGEKSTLAITNLQLLQAFNEHFKDSYIAINKTVVYGEKYDIYVKNDLEIVVVEHDKNYLKDGEIALSYSIPSYNCVYSTTISLSVEMGGEIDYPKYAQAILQGKTQAEKETLFVEAELYYAEEWGYLETYEGILQENLYQYIIESWGYSSTEGMLMDYGYSSFDELLIDSQYVKPKEFYAKYIVTITMPNLTTRTINMLYGTNSFTHPVTSNGNYIFTGKTVQNKTAKLTAVVSNITDNPVAAVLDEVPIPYGFVASPYDGENTIDEGFVIYELAEGESSIPSSETQVVSKTTRNQYVWVPVPDFSQFIRRSFSSGTVSNILGTSNQNWEVELDSNNKPIPYSSLSSNSKNYITEKTVNESIAMYNSVEKYGGFYVARYEYGSSGKSIQSSEVRFVGIWNSSGLMSPDVAQPVNIARSAYTNSNPIYGATSTLIYGVQWDTVLNWYLTSGALTTLSTYAYGNHRFTNINSSVTTYNTGAKYSLNYPTYVALTLNDSKPDGTSWHLTSGAVELTKVKNIYDISGNFSEWTMEGYSTNCRVLRGGDNFYYSSFTNRDNQAPASNQMRRSLRIALYIK